MKFHNLDRVFRREDFTENDLQTILNAGGAGGNNVSSGGGGGGNNSGGNNAAGQNQQQQNSQQQSNQQQQQQSNQQQAGNNGQQQNSQQQGNGNAGGKNGGAANPAAPAEGHIDYRTLGFKTADELTGRLGHIQKLEKDLNEAKAAPKFKSDRSKWIYDFANRFEGMERSAALNVLRLSDLQPDKMEGHQLRFEAFSLNPKYMNLNPEDRMLMFMDEERKAFGDKPEETPENAQAIRIRQLRIDQATTEAKAEVGKILTEYNNTRAVERTPEEELAERTAYQNHVKEKLTGFDGFDLGLSATEEGKTLESKLNYKFEGTQAADILAAVSNPNQWWASIMERNGALEKGADGKVAFNERKFGELVAKIELADKLLNLGYTQGRADKHSDLLKNRRNGSNGNEMHNSHAYNGGNGGNNGNLSELEQAGMAALKTIGG